MTNNQRGMFITFDGIDGAGKTTQIEYLEKWLLEQGKHVYVTREPGGTELSEQIRSLLLDKKNTMHVNTELLLMFASRAEHIEQILRPKLDAGVWIICSRFTDATMAYQGYARDIDKNIIQILANAVHADCNPDISFFLDLPAEEALKRRQQRGEKADRIESEALSFMHAVRNGYLEIAECEPQRCKVINAQQSREDMARDIQQYMDELS